MSKVKTLNEATRLKVNTDFLRAQEQWNLPPKGQGCRSW